MVQLFVHGFAEDTADATLEEALSRCAAADAHFTWMRARKPSGEAAGFGFADVMELHNAGRIIKVVGGIGHDSKLPFQVVPDAAMSSQCMGAAEAVAPSLQGLDELRVQIAALFDADAEAPEADSKADNKADKTEEVEPTPDKADPKAAKAKPIVDKVAAASKAKSDRKAELEARVQAVVRLEPRPDGMSDEEYGEIRAFRLGQARTEIAEDDERRRQLLALVEERRRQRRADARSMAKADGGGDDEEGKEKEKEPEAVASSAALAAAKSAPVKMKLKAKESAQAGVDGGHNNDDDDDDDDDDDEEGEEADATTVGRKRKLVVDETADKLARANVLKKTKALLEAPKVRKIIVKHLERYLGEADQDFTEHVLALVQADATNKTLVEKVTPILDDDAAKFVAELEADLDVRE